MAIALTNLGSSSREFKVCSRAKLIGYLKLLSGGAEVRDRRSDK